MSNRNRIFTSRLFTAAAVLAAAATMSFTASPAQAGIDPAAKALADAVTAKMKSAQTVKVTAKHTLSPSLSLGVGHEKAPMQITVKRPNQVYILQSAGEETQEIAMDGKSLCLMRPGPKLHALEPLAARDLDQLADRVDERFGFRPPVMELLSADFSTQIFRDVTSAKVVGTEWVGLTRCERLHFVQEGMTGDVWIGKKDSLPRRYLLTFTDLKGPPTWDIRLSQWQLNAPVDAALFSKRPAADSQKTPMVKSRQ